MSGFLLTAMIFTGCIMEHFETEFSDIPAGEGDLMEVTLPGYLAINLNIPGNVSTRADGNNKPSVGDEFHDGETSEYSLAPGRYHYIILYTNGDNKDERVILPLTIDDSDIDYTSGNYDQTDNEGNVTSYDNLTFVINKIYVTTEFPNRLFNNKDEVSNFLEKYTDGNVLLNFSSEIIKNSDNNYSTSEEYLKSISCNQLRGLELSDYTIKVGNTSYHTMSNEVSVNNNKYSFKFDYGRVYDTREEAKSAAKQGNVFISCPVERVSTKYTVEFAEELKNQPSQEEILLTIYPKSTVKLFDNTKGENGLIIGTDSYEIAYKDKGWELDVLGYGMNAQEESSYLFKKLTKTDYFNDWYDSYRGYWAEDLHYTITGGKNGNIKNYPDQFRQAIEGMNDVRNLHKGGLKDDGNLDLNNINEECYLKFYSFNEFKQRKDATIYTHENTYENGSLLGKRGYFSASTHLIMVGAVRVNDVASGSDLYVDQNGIFFTTEKDILSNKLQILNSIILPGGVHGLRVIDANWLRLSGYEEDNSIDHLTILNWPVNSVLWVEQNNTFREVTAEDLRLIPAEIAGGDGSVLIAPKSELVQFCLAPAVTDENGNRDMDRILENQSFIDGNQLISLIHKSIGSIDHYKEGFTYYPAGIPHAKSQTYPDCGSYGSVRNNWYSLTVKSVDGLGLPVDDPDQPIIPTQLVKRDYLNMTVNILNWHKISQGIPESKL